MATFYTGVDKSIYQGGDHYVPMEKFRLNPYEKKNLSYESSQPQSYGITNTNAFTNSGGAFNASGNAFGYGSAIGPSQGYGQYGTPSYTGGLPGNVTQQGTGRNFMADMDPNYWEGEPGSEWINSYQMTTGKNKQLPAFANFALSFVPGGNFIRSKIEKGMNDPRVNQPSYRIGGMDDFTKGAYDTLAGEGMLFDGSAGIKTLTGKNFGAKGYFEGQEELAKEFGFDKMDDDEIESYISQFSLQNPKKSFKVKQMKEAWKMSKYRSNKLDQQIKEDNKRAAEEARNAKIAADMKYHNEHTPTATGGMTYNEIVDNMVQDRSEEMRGRPGGIGGKELMATGGRVGLNYGGLASMLGREDFKKGGRIGFFQGALADTKEGKAMSPGTTASGDFRGDGGQGDGGNTVVVPKTNYIDVKPDLLRENPYVNINLTSPLHIAKLKARFGMDNIFENDDLYAEGNLTTNLGPVTTNTQFTDDGIGNTDINWNNLSATIDANKNLQNIGYNNSWNGIDYGINYADGNTMFNVGTTFKNGGLARLL